MIMIIIKVAWLHILQAEAFNNVLMTKEFQKDIKLKKLKRISWWHHWNIILDLKSIYKSFTDK